MTRRIALFVLPALLAACAVEPEQPAPSGLWVVTDAFPAGPSPSPREAVIGLKVRLDPNEATDLMGRTCPQPAYRRGRAGEAEFLGNGQRAEEIPGLGRAVPVLEVMCGDQAFGSYAEWRDGSLMARLPGLVARLERAETVQPRAPVAGPIPVQLAPVAPAPAVAAAPAPSPAPAHSAAAPSPAGHRLVYLASYRNAATAERGFKELAAKSPTLKRLHSATRSVDLGAKGRFVRLYAKAGSEAEARRICAELKMNDCGAAGR